jgi:hypothetical protein
MPGRLHTLTGSNRHRYSIKDSISKVSSIELVAKFIHVELYITPFNKYYSGGWKSPMLLSRKSHFSFFNPF